MASVSAHRGNLQYIANAIFNRHIIFTHCFLGSSEALASLCCTQVEGQKLCCWWQLVTVACSQSSDGKMVRKALQLLPQGWDKVSAHHTEEEGEREEGFKSLLLFFTLSTFPMASMSLLLSLPGLFLYNLFAAYILDLNHL